MENHNSEPMGLKRGHTIERVTSWVVTREKQGQEPEKLSDAIQSIVRMSYDTDTGIGGTSTGDAEKAGW